MTLPATTSSPPALDEPAKLIDIVSMRAPDDDRRVRLVDGEHSWTARQLRNEVARCVVDLQAHGVRPGERLLAVLDHDVHAAVVLAAASALGLHLIMPYGLHSAALPEWLAIVRTARPGLVLHARHDPAGAAELAGAGVRVVRLPRPSEPAPDAEVEELHPEPVPGFLVLFSSGTTGAPKGMSIPEALITRKIASISGQLRFAPQSRILMTGLMNNTTGVIFTFGGLLRGSTVVFPRSADPASWPARVRQHRITHLQLRPVALKQFITATAAAALDLSGLEVIAYGGGAVPRAVIAEGRRLLPGDWVQGYGLSETYGPFCWLDEAAHRQGRHLGQVYCVGRPDDTVEVRLEPAEGHPDGVGEVLVRGAVMEGYLDVATGTLRGPDPWLRTGDLACWSPDGDLVLKGRRAGALLTGNGHRIYPEEIEAVLANVPGADDVVLVGVPQPDTHQERPVAVLCGPLAQQDGDAVVRLVVRELARTLAREKWPDLVYVTAQPFPESANGKVRRGEVAAAVDPRRLLDLSSAQADRPEVAR
ncbi:MAG TPA: fatty acid--CoA ligase family protein [Kineosporiaceae bacterium]